jgi:hypothetical protein
MTVGIAAAAASCTPEAATGPVPTIETASFAAALNVNLANMTKMSNGVYFQDIPAGNGTTAASGNHLTVHYTGYFTNGTSFDTSIGKAPFGFTLGAGSVIKGWDEGRRHAEARDPAGDGIWWRVVQRNSAELDSCLQCAARFDPVVEKTENRRPKRVLMYEARRRN